MADKIKVLRVVARKESFRRAGHQFGAEPVVIPMDQLDKRQLAAIVADPELVATELEVDAEEVEAVESSQAAATPKPATAQRGQARQRSRG